VVFCNTKRETQEVTDTLGEHGFSALIGEDGIASDQVGKIKVRSFRARRVKSHLKRPALRSAIFNKP
jgi:uncharacterized membrane-anchored protein